MLVALTGATGFVGRHVAEALLQAGHSVRALARRPEDLQDQPSLSICPGDITDKTSLGALVAGAEVVVHGAAVLRGGGSAAYQAVNVQGSENLAAAARDAGVGRFLLLSSLAAREPQLSAYAASKRGAEAAVARLADTADQLSWEALRPPVVYGPGDRATLDFFRQWQRGWALRPGSAEARVSMLYVGDLARAITALLAQEAQSGRIYEVHDGQPGGYRWDDLVGAAERVFQRSIRRQRIPKIMLLAAASADTAWASLRRREPKLTIGKVEEIYHPDWSCQDNLLDHLPGWSGTVRLQEGFEKTVAWYKARHWL